MITKLCRIKVSDNRLIVFEYLLPFEVSFIFKKPPTFIRDSNLNFLHDFAVPFSKV